MPSPDIQLLYKSADPQEKDEADFQSRAHGPRRISPTPRDEASMASCDTRALIGRSALRYSRQLRMFDERLWEGQANR